LSWLALEANAAIAAPNARDAKRQSPGHQDERSNGTGHVEPVQAHAGAEQHGLLEGDDEQRRQQLPREQNQGANGARPKTIPRPPRVLFEDPEPHRPDQEQREHHRHARDCLLGPLGARVPLA
jgi:hypothetical protein